jgi:hypothetical protein
MIHNSFCALGVDSLRVKGERVTRIQDLEYKALTLGCDAESEELQRQRERVSGLNHWSHGRPPRGTGPC